MLRLSRLYRRPAVSPYIAEYVKAYNTRQAAGKESKKSSPPSTSTKPVWRPFDQPPKRRRIVVELDLGDKPQRKGGKRNGSHMRLSSFRGARRKRVAQVEHHDSVGQQVIDIANYAVSRNYALRDWSDGDSKAKDHMQESMDEIRNLLLNNEVSGGPSVRTVCTAIQQWTKLCVKTGLEVWFVEMYREFLDELMSLAIEKVDELDVNRCITTVFCLSRLSDVAPDLVRGGSKMRQLVLEMGGIVQRKAYTFNENGSRVIAMYIHGLAKLGFYDADLLDRVAKLVLDKVGQFDGGGLASIVWAYGKLNHNDSFKMTDRVAQIFYSNMRRFSGQESSMIVWGLARLKHRKVNMLIDCLMDGVKFTSQEFTPLHTSRLLSACAMTRYDPGDDRLHLLARMFVSNYRWYTPSIASSTVLALANFSCLSENVVGTVVKQFLLKVKGRVPLTEYCKIVKALAIGGCLSVSMLKNCVKLVLSRHRDLSVVDENNDHMNCLPDDAKCDLFMGILMNEMGLCNDKKRMKIQEELHDMCKAAWVKNGKKAKHTGLLNNLHRILAKMEIPCKEHAYVDSINMHVDGMLSINDQDVAINVVDDEDMFVNVEGKLNGMCLWRERIVESSSFKVLRISAPKWRSLNLESEKREYLVTKLKRLGWKENSVRQVVRDNEGYLNAKLERGRGTIE